MAQSTASSKRSGKQCQKWAVRGKTKCRMHGGVSTGPRTKEGKVRAHQAAFRHGGHTKQARAQLREIMALIRQSKNLLRIF